MEKREAVGQSFFKRMKTSLVEVWRHRHLHVGASVTVPEAPVLFTRSHSSREEEEAGRKSYFDF